MVSNVKKKYEHWSAATIEQTTRESLGIIRKAFTSSGGEFLLGNTLSYAAIDVGAALE